MSGKIVVVVGHGAPLGAAHLKALLQHATVIDSVDRAPYEVHTSSCDRAIVKFKEDITRLELKMAESQTLGEFRDYWFNFMDMREREVSKQTRKPPKKAICSSRHRGRKCKK